jgi:hypothetical protein
MVEAPRGDLQEESSAFNWKVLMQILFKILRDLSIT